MKQLTRQDIADLISALDGAITDAEYYFNSGHAESDYQAYPEDLKGYKAKVERWRKLMVELSGGEI